MGAVAAIGGALVQASAAKKAAKAQTSAANKDIAFQKETRDLIRSDLGVYREGGDLAQRALDFELGLGARPTFGGTAPQIETYSIPGTPQNSVTSPIGTPPPSIASISPQKVIICVSLWFACNKSSAVFGGDFTTSEDLVRMVCNTFNASAGVIDDYKI